MDGPSQKTLETIFPKSVLYGYENFPRDLFLFKLDGKLRTVVVSDWYNDKFGITIWDLKGK